MESSTNRFIDAEDQSVDGCNLIQMMDNTDKWSLKNDLELLSHLKQLSNTFITKTEATNQSINSLVFEAKMHCVKVDNVINEFQMLANSQFVENRVYDEEMDDIMADGQTVAQNEELVSTRSRDEDIMPKIKSALNIGLDFLNQRFDCVSKQVSQNDSDDENDQIVEGLISDSTRSEYSQRLLPYIIGSEDFFKDNYVGLNYVEESPAIDLKTKSVNDIEISVKSVDHISDTNSNTFNIRNSISNKFIDDTNDSEEESGDIFGVIPQSMTNNQTMDSSDESDFEPTLDRNEEQNEENIVRQTDDTIESKQTFISFQDELAAAIGAKNPIKQNKQLSVSEVIEPKTELFVNKVQTNLGLESDSSSDENDSIFKVIKTLPKVENKQKSNFSNLFGEEEEDNEKSLFEPKLEKPKVSERVNKVLKNSNPIPKKTLSLFEDDDEEDDDLFVSAFSKKSMPTTKPIVDKEVEKLKTAQNIVKNEKPIERKDSLFDDEEDDDLFVGIASKSKQNSGQNIDAFKPIVKPTVSSLNKPKPPDSLIGELSSALKKKNLYQSESEEEGSDDQKDDNLGNDYEFNKNSFSEMNSEKQTNLFDGNDQQLDETIESTEDLVPKVDNESIDIKDNDKEFYSDKTPTPLPNEGLKHRALLAAKRNRRPPTKKILKLTPIIDFNQSFDSNRRNPLSSNEDISAPIAAIRTVKTTNSVTNHIDSNLKPQSNEQNVKSLSSLVKSPSTEEEDIFPNESNSSKNQNISKIFEKSDTTSGVFDDFEDNDESVFTSSKTNNDVLNRVVNKTGLFDTSDSDEDKFGNSFDNKLNSNIISNLIKPLNNDIFNDVSSTDSSLSNKSDLKIGNSKPKVSLFSDSDDDDLFSAVNKSKAIDKTVKKEPIIDTKESIKSDKTFEKSKMNSIFSESEDEISDLFQRNENIETKPKLNSKAKVKAIFDSEDSDDDIFAAKPSKKKTSKPMASKPKPKTDKENPDLFDDPLFVSRT